MPYSSCEHCFCGEEFLTDETNKTRLRSQLSVDSLSDLMKIAIESPNELTETDLENIVDIWNSKPRRIVV